jgi:PAS domain-containing protein
MNLLIIFSVLLGFSAVCYFLLSVRLINGEREIGSLPLGVTFLIISFWVIGGAVEMMAPNYVVFSIGRVGHFLGTALIPVALLLCFREFTGRVTARITVIELSIIPILSIIIAATNYWHEFMWYLPATNEAGEFLTRPYEFGPWFNFIHVPYGYAVTGTSIFTLIMHSPAVAPSQRRGLFLLAGSALVPVIGIVAYDLGIGPDTISTLPIIFALMLPVYGWMVISEGIIEFSPLAYETVFQNMQDPVIVVDEEERIIGLNHGAEALLNMNESDAMRVSLDVVFGEEASEVHTAIATGLPQKMLTSSGRFLHVQVTPISGNSVVSRNASVLMFRDVSDVEKAQREVLNSEKLLRTLIDHSVNGIIRLRWVTGEAPGAEKELRCIFANAAAGRYLNSEPASMIDCTIEELHNLCTTGKDSV